jgi:hypothetical protein
MYSYNKSTYSELANDVLADINEESKTSILSPETMQMWILDAEKQICDRIEVRDEWRLRLALNQTNYPFRDRAIITNATNASPIVVTSASHGLVNDEFIVVIGVGGNDAANGKWQVKSASTDAFSLYQYANVVGASNATPINIVTDEAHGFTTGNSITIAGVLGNTAANGTFAVTVVDALNFTLDASVGTGAYTSGGVATKVSTGSGAFTSGGRFWSQAEIPTFFKSFILGDRIWSTVHRPVKPREIQELLGLQRQSSELYVAYTSLDAPFGMADWIDNGQKQLMVYPPPQDSETMILYGRIKITPRLYQTDDLDSVVHLSTDYDEAIKRYVTYKTYSWLKDRKNMADAKALYDEEVDRLRLAFPRNIVQQITYT